MFSLNQLHVSKQQTSSGNTVFYVRFEPSQLDEFPTGSEFTIVYSPTAYHGWEAVTYRVIEPRKAYAVLERRPLTRPEQDYFQSLLEMSTCG